MNFTSKQIEAYIGKKISMLLKGGNRIEECIVEKSEIKGQVRVFTRNSNASYNCGWQILISEIAAIGIYGAQIQSKE